MWCSRHLGIAAVTVLFGAGMPSAGMALAHRASAPYPRAVMYAGLQNGGIYRSADGGSSWQEMDSGMPSNVDVTALQINAVGAIYAGTNGSGVFISTDGGQSWQPDNNGNSDLDGADVVGLAVNPAYREDIYAAAQDGTVYTSYSGGQYWSAHAIGSSSNLTALVDDPQDPGTMLVATESDGIYRSTDYSYNWQQTSGIPGDVSAKALAFDPHNGQVVYAATDGGIYQSVDGGETWQAEQAGIPDGMAFQSVAVDPRDGSRVIAGTSDGQFYLSTDGGTSWESESGAGSSPVSALIFDPAHAGRILAGTPDGSSFSTSYDGGASWDASDPGFGAGNGILCLAALGRPALPTAPVAQVDNSSSVQYFPQTHHILRGLLLPFYNRYGGLAVFGLPLTEEFIENGQLVQYFERARLAQVGSRVLVSPLGSQVTTGRYFPTVSPFTNSVTRLYFANTGHSLSGRFLTFWQRHHGQLLFGSPISEPLREQNGDGTGRTYLVQYFQNARLEYHPELSGTSYVVSLGLLGRQVLKQRGWL